ILKMKLICDRIQISAVFRPLEVEIVVGRPGTLSKHLTALALQWPNGDWSHLERIRIEVNRTRESSQATDVDASALRIAHSNYRPIMALRQFRQPWHWRAHRVAPCNHRCRGARARLAGPFPGDRLARPAAGVYRKARSLGGGLA